MDLGALNPSTHATPWVVSTLPVGTLTQVDARVKGTGLTQPQHHALCVPRPWFPSVEEHAQASYEDACGGAPHATTQAL